MTVVEQLAVLPEPIQEQLLRIARLATGMSADEKGTARLFIAAGGMQICVDSADDEDMRLPTAELLTACGRIVQYADEQAGDNASWLVV
jgi:hypothetical protein